MLFIKSSLKSAIFSVLQVVRNQRFSSNIKTNKMCTNIVWMDLEMTGLDIKTDKILEISCLITDKDLKILSEGPTIVIKQNQQTLDNMNEWCIKNHAQSGLTQRCLESNITIERAEQMLLDYLKRNIPKGECPLAGNSVYMDRLFLRAELPNVDNYLHYRIIDVSTVKELSRRWKPVVFYEAPRKKLAHRSLDDIKESIKELQYYRECFFQHD